MKKYFSRSLMLVGLLGFYSGLPLALTASTLTAWLADAKIDRAAIGLFAAIGTPYAIKFLWAPLVDGLRIPLLAHLGRRRSWLLLTQLLLSASIAAMAMFNPETSVSITAIAALAVATFSATQDIVIDAYRVELLSDEQQGLGAASATFGYRIGMLVSGAGALALADLWGWHTTYITMAIVMASSILISLVARDPSVAIPDTRNFGEFLANSVIAPLADFMTRPHWFALLLFVILYKLGDALLGVMFNPFLLELGFSKTQIAEAVKLYGLAATLAGSFFGGWLVVRLGAMRTMLLGGLIHGAANLLLIPQAHLGADMGFLILNTILINFTGGAGLTAFVAYLSALCKRTYTGTQYALLSALSAVGRTLLSTPSGWLAVKLGWPWFFALCCALTIPGLLVLWWIERSNQSSVHRI